MTHTPGPWAYDAESGTVIAPEVGYHHVTPPIICTIEPLQYGEDAGNGALIAAATRLLEALQMFVAEFGDKTTSATVNQARAALAAANGEKV